MSVTAQVDNNIQEAGTKKCIYLDLLVDPFVINVSGLVDSHTNLEFEKLRAEQCKQTIVMSEIGLFNMRSS